MASYLRFQINRKSRKIRQKFYIWRVWLTNYANRHIYGGWKKLGLARWVFVAFALVCIVSLFGFWSQVESNNKHYLTEAPTYGGIYSEGLVGSVKSVNPIFPDNSATTDVNSVVFSGLTRVGSNRQIEGDLAKSWEISADKKVYTFHLRDGIKWHDGKDLNTDDIAFTISRIQNPDTRSPLASNWSGVKYEIIDNKTIKLILPNSYSSFLYNASVGILPKHILENVKPALMKTNEFNQKPIGSGPYRLTSINEGDTKLNLESFSDYYFGRPYIDKLQFVLFDSSNDFLEGYQKKQILGFTISRPELESKASKINELKINNLSLPAYSALFLNMKSPLLSDVKLRQALAYATDKRDIVSSVLKDQGVVVNYPILAGYSGFDSSVTKYDYNPTKAKELIAQLNQEQINSTSLRIVTLKDSVYEEVAKDISDKWSKVGVKTNVIAVPLDELQQRYIRSRNYDILLYGQDLGYDSDIYAYWHSSQATDPGLNLSQYINVDADRFLETGRVAKDADYKNSRYTGFLQNWAKDVPAIILYSPYYDYAQDKIVKGLSANKLVEPSNRFLDIQNWYIKTKQTIKYFDLDNN